MDFCVDTGGVDGGLSILSVFQDGDAAPGGGAPGPAPPPTVLGLFSPHRGAT